MSDIDDKSVDILRNPGKYVDVVKDGMSDPKKKLLPAMTEMPSMPTRLELKTDPAKVVFPFPGRVVSPEIDSENARRGGYGVEAADIFHKLNKRTKHQDLDLPKDLDVEKALIESGAYQLGTGPHHVSTVNKPKSGTFVKNPDSDKLLQLVLFKIQNVHDYFMEHANEHEWYDPESFSSLKMPYNGMLFSYDHQFKHPVSGELILRHVNVLMEKQTVDEFLKFLIQRAKLSESDRNELAHIVDRRQPDSMIQTTIIFDGVSLPGLWFLMIDETGHVLTDKVHNQNWFWIRDPEQHARLQEMIEMGLQSEDNADGFARQGMICCTAIQFLNCRNVEVLDNGPTRQQRRHAERMGKRPPVTYKTLVIHPMGQKRVKTHNDDGTVVHGVPLHIVRGHFKSYMAGAGLGRAHVHGVYWWSPQVRGNAERGRIEKDYEVTEP